MANEQTKQKRRRPCRFPGITDDAKTLGVSRNWLYAVLSGRYEAPELLARYRAFEGARQECPTTGAIPKAEGVQKGF
jgi:hypothetical protein